MTRGGAPAGAVDLFEDDARLGDTQTQPTIGAWDERRQVAGLGQRID